jgi:hypothetical protein
MNKALPIIPAAVELPELLIQTVNIEIIGDSPLIMHAWSQKARMAMEDKQQRKAAKGRDAKVPWDDFVGALYWLDGAPEKPTEADVENGRFGMPSVAFKSAAVDACTSVAAMTKVAARQSFHVDGEFVEIIGGPPSMRTDMARVGQGTADIRYRPEFNPWSAVLTVKVNVSAISIAQVVGLFDLAGFAVGIGDWRPQRNGPYGRFHVAKAGERASQ